jgi:hypothetical protein
MIYTCESQFERDADMVCIHCGEYEATCYEENCVAHLGFQFVDLFANSRVEQSDRESLKATTLEAAVAEMMEQLHERADWFFGDDDEKVWAVLDRNNIVWSATLRSPLGSMVRP